MNRSCACGCGEPVPVERGPLALYASAGCSQRARDERRRDAKRVYFRAYREANAERLRAKAKAYAALQILPRVARYCTCCDCGVSWVRLARRTIVAKRCAECITQRNRASANRYERDRSPRACRRCHREFTPAYGDKRRDYCSRSCLRAATKSGTHRKRARRAGVAYEPVSSLEVFERDNWRCCICGGKTRKDLVGSVHPLAPTLDHRVPLSRGGPHTYANTQCAHRKCNTDKAARSSRGQLPLWARRAGTRRPTPRGDQFSRSDGLVPRGLPFARSGNPEDSGSRGES